MYFQLSLTLDTCQIEHVRNPVSGDADQRAIRRRKSAVRSPVLVGVFTPTVSETGVCVYTGFTVPARRSGKELRLICCS